MAVLLLVATLYAKEAYLYIGDINLDSPRVQKAQGVLDQVFYESTATFGQVLYFNGTKYALADVGAKATVLDPVMVVSQNTFPGLHTVIRKGYVEYSEWSWTAGDVLYISAAGAISTDENYAPIGVAIKPDKIYFDSTLLSFFNESGAGFTEEEVQDIVGAMVSGNTETNITVTYEDGDGTLDFVVAGAGGDIISEGNSYVEVTDADAGRVDIVIDSVGVVRIDVDEVIFYESIHADAGDEDIGEVGTPFDSLFVGDAVLTGTLQAEHLYSTDDAVVTDSLYVGGNVVIMGDIGIAGDEISAVADLVINENGDMYEIRFNSSILKLSHCYTKIGDVDGEVWGTYMYIDASANKEFKLYNGDINLNGNYISGDGDTEGMTINAYGSAAFTDSVDIAGLLTIGAFTITNVDGSDGQVLTTDGAGSVAWETPSGGGATDKIEEGNSSVEVIDAGTGEITVTIDTNKILIINGDGITPGDDKTFNNGAADAYWLTTYTDTLRCTELYATDGYFDDDVSIVDSLYVGGNAVINGNLTVNGAFSTSDAISEGDSYVEVIDAGAGYIDVGVDGEGNTIFKFGNTENTSYLDLIPDTDSANDLGASDKYWKHTYTDSLSGAYATLTGTLQAEHLYSTDDADITGDITIAGADGGRIRHDVSGTFCIDASDEFGDWTKMIEMFGSLAGSYINLFGDYVVIDEDLYIGSELYVDTLFAFNADFIKASDDFVIEYGEALHFPISTWAVDSLNVNGNWRINIGTFERIVFSRYVAAATNDWVEQLSINTSGDVIFSGDFFPDANNSYDLGYTPDGAWKKIYIYDGQFYDDVDIDDDLNVDGIITTDGLVTDGSEGTIIYLDPTLADGEFTSSEVYPATAGMAIAFGDPLYIKSDGEMYVCDCDSTGAYPCIGVAVTTGTDGNAVYYIKTGRICESDWDFSIGDKIYFDDSGSLTATPPAVALDKIQIVGTIVGTDILEVQVATPVWFRVAE